MDTSKFSVKFFLSTSAPPADVIVPVLHTWIQNKAVPDHLLVDVADYAHVADGPGTVLIADEGNFHLDHGQGEPGLLYVRKRPLTGTLEERVSAVFRIALGAVERLEADPALSGKVKFRRDKATFRVNDRLNGPNTPESFAALKPALESVVAEMLPGRKLELTNAPSGRTLLEVRIG